jgi:hypothetical protein
MKQKINLSKAVPSVTKRSESGKIQHKIKIAAAYLNLLASQRLLISQRKKIWNAPWSFQNVLQSE